MGIKIRKPEEKLNARIRLAKQYLRTVGWARGTHAEKGEPCDIVGALRHCADTDGYEVVAQRMLASRGYDIAWNDLECLNMWEALQAFDHEYTSDELAAVYGARHWYAIVGILVLLTMASEGQAKKLAAHIGPADEPSILAAVDRVGRDNPGFEDAHLVVSRYGFDPRVWLMTDALVANSLMFPDLDDRLVSVLAPIGEKLGL